MDLAHIVIGLAAVCGLFGAAAGYAAGVKLLLLHQRYLDSALSGFERVLHSCKDDSDAVGFVRFGESGFAEVRVRLRRLSEEDVEAAEAILDNLGHVIRG
ncbi:hypothetical protein BC936DRAFT_140531 [Jimgerdemannia flammicorona]|uniref:Uncharacterized protein n=1 Tax=Jimgerdemannia flammicorona TaxID=994334 RepID=A0A433AQI1_9FUNG|nr:hypothetical protein BC936DRAFT_140531 [Jimgerdemannia flammicorona]